MWWDICKVLAAAALLALVALTEPWWVTCCVSAGASFWAMQGMDNDEADDE
jgi:hypothetical protein